MGVPSNSFLILRCSTTTEQEPIGTSSSTRRPLQTMSVPSSSILTRRCTTTTGQKSIGTSSSTSRPLRTMSVPSNSTLTMPISTSVGTRFISCLKIAYKSIIDYSRPPYYEQINEYSQVECFVSYDAVPNVVQLLIAEKPRSQT